MLSQITPIYKHQKERLLQSQIQQIRSELSHLLSTDRSFNMFYFDSEKIILLLRFVLNPASMGEISEAMSFTQNEYEELFKIEQLRQIYSQKEIIYAIITSLFRVQNIYISETDEIDVRIGSNLFLQQKPRSQALLFEVILQAITSGNLQPQQQYFELISQQIKTCIGEMKKNEKLFLLECEEQSNTTSYSHYLTVKLNKDTNIENVDRQISINFSSFSHFCIDLAAKWQAKFSQPIEQSQINDVMLILGLAIHLESKKKYTQNMIATYQSLSFELQVKQNHKQKEIVVLLTFKLPKQSKGVSLSEFMDDQKETLKKLQKEISLKCSQLCLSNNIYLIDPFPIFEKGLKIRNATIYQLEGSVFIDEAHRSYYFSHRQCTVKMVSQNRFKALQSKEVRIANLIKEIQHKQQILKARKSIGFEENPPLSGLNRLVEVIQTIEFSSDDFSQSYIVSQTYEEELEKYNKTIFKQPDPKKKSVYIFQICLQIAEGLNCLHYQIAKRYDFELIYHSGIKDQECSLFGIYHCEIKPTNIMVRNRENGIQIRLIDFSVSIFAREDAKLNRIEKKHCNFMPPQAKKGRNIEEHIDIWSLGAIIFELWNDGTPLPPTQGQIFLHLQRNQKMTAKWKSITKRMLSEQPSIRINSVDVLCQLYRNKYNILVRSHESLMQQFAAASKFEIVEQGKVRKAPQYQLKAENIVHANRYNLQQLIKSYQWFQHQKINVLACATYYRNFNIAHSMFHTIQIAFIQYSQSVKEAAKTVSIVMVYEKLMNSKHQTSQFPIQFVSIQNTTEQQTVAAVLREKTAYHKLFDSCSYFQGYRFFFDKKDKSNLLVSPILLKPQTSDNKTLYYQIKSSLNLFYRQPPSSGLITLQLAIGKVSVVEDLVSCCKEIVQFAEPLQNVKITYQQAIRIKEKKLGRETFGTIQLQRNTVKLKINQKVEKFFNFYLQKIKLFMITNDLYSLTKRLLALPYKNSWQCDYSLMFKLSNLAFEFNKRNGKIPYLFGFDFINPFDQNSKMTDFTIMKDPASVGLKLKGIISLLHISNNLEYPPLLSRILRQLTHQSQALLSQICQRAKRVFEWDIAHMINWEGEVTSEHEKIWTRIISLMEKCDQIIGRSELTENQRLKWGVVYKNYILFHNNCYFMKLILDL